MLRSTLVYLLRLVSGCSGYHRVSLLYDPLQLPMGSQEINGLAESFLSIVLGICHPYSTDKGLKLSILL
jgi:hypothetical protein